MFHYEAIEHLQGTTFTCGLIHAFKLVQECVVDVFLIVFGQQ